MSTPQQQPTAAPSGGEGPPASGERSPAQRSGGSGGRSTVGTVRIVVIAVLAVLLIVLGLANLDPVPLDYVVGQTNVALLLVMAISALLGAAVGALAVWRAKS